MELYAQVDGSSDQDSVGEWAEMSRNSAAAVAIVIAMAGCGFGARRFAYTMQPHLLPEGQGLPDREIVFAVDFDVLGFIHPDGSGFVTRTVDLSGWDGFKLLLRAKELELYVTWAPGGEYVAGRYSVVHRSAGPPMLISNQGKFLRCDDLDMAPYGSFRSWVTSGTNLLTVDTEPINHRVLILNLESCTLVETLYTASSPDEYISEATLSVHGWLALDRYVGVDDHVLIIDPDGNQFTILSANFPTWSPDGEWLAYFVKGDGIYVARKDGSDHRKLVDITGPADVVPSWSPDGEWLVYSERQVIYKVNVATGAKQLLFEGGNNPNWRWPSTTQMQ